MPRRPLYLPNDVDQRASDLQFSNDVERRISDLTFPRMVEDGIGRIRQGAEEVRSRLLPLAPALPIVVSPRPEPQPFQQQPQGQPMPGGVSGEEGIEPSFISSISQEQLLSPTQPYATRGDFSVGGQPQAMPQGEPDFSRGANPEAQARAYRTARASGLDDEGARIVAAVLETEGGTRGAIGDQGQARGGLQFHERGEMPGFRAWLAQQGIQGDPNQLVNDIDLTTRYAATGYLGRAIEEGRRLGLTGSALATYAQQHGQRSETPEKTGANYERLYGGQRPAPSGMDRMPDTPATSAGMVREPVPIDRPDPTGGSPFERQAFSAGSYTPNQISAATAEGLDYETALAVCGPAAAIAFARKNGRNPTMQEAVQLAREVGWTASAGMAGPASQQRLLERMGVAARLVEGTPDWRGVAADVQRGNPVTISTPGHYFVAERFDPESGAFDFGESARVLKASGGKRWFRPEELPGLGMGAPRASLFIDNPESPTPSAVAGPSALNAGPPPASAPGGDSPTAGSGDMMLRQAIGGNPVPMPGSVDAQATGGFPEFGVPERAVPGRPVGIGESMTGPIGPGDLVRPIDRRDARPYDMTDREGVDASLELPSNRYEQEGLIQPPIPAPDYSTGMGAQPGVMYRGPLSQQPELPADEPYDPRLYDEGAREAPPPTFMAGRPEDDPGQQQSPTLTPPPGPYAPGQAASMEPDPQRFAPGPTETQRGLLPVWDEGRRIVGYVQENARPAADAVMQAAESLPGPVRGIPNPVPIVRAIAKPGGGAAGQQERMSQINAQAARDQGRTDFRSTIGSEAVLDPGWRAANPELAAEYDELEAAFNMTVGLGTVGDAGRFVNGRWINDTVPTAASAADLVDAAGAGIRAAGGALRTGARAVGEAAEGLGTRVTEGLRANQGRVTALDAQMAQQGSTAAPGVFGISGLTPDTPGVQGMRPRVVPPEVADTLDFPVRIPEDPRVIRAIEAAGGSIDPERGVTLHVTRAQGPQSAGGVATRGGVFYEAIPEGGRSSFANASDDPTGVGGSQVIPRTPTRFRSPLILEDAPGSQVGFDQAAQQLGINRPAATDGDIAMARQRYEDARAQRDAAYASPNQAFNGMSAGLHDANVRDAYSEIQRLTGGLPLTARSIDADIRVAQRVGPEGSPERAQALRDLVMRYGGDPALIDDLLTIRGADASESAWAIKENILAAHARKQGYDGVITVQPRSPDPKEIDAHPAVKAAEAERFEINRRLGQITREIDEQAMTLPEISKEAALQDPKIAALIDEYNQLYLRRDQMPQVMEDARTQAYRELSTSRISELVDVREGRNPTPGAPNPRIAEAQSIVQAAEDASKAYYDAVSRLGSLDHPDVIAARDALRAARASERDTGAVHFLEGVRARGESTHSGEPGYTLRSDIPRRPDPGSTSASASAGALPQGSGGTGVFGAVNRGVGEVLAGGTGGAVIEQARDPDDPNAAARGFAVGAVGFPAASRIARGAARAAGRSADTGGALATLGSAPQGGRPRRGPLPEGARPITATDADEVSRLRLDKFPEEVRADIESAARGINWAREQRRGVIPDEVAQRMAADDLRSVDQWIKQGKAGKTYNTEETYAIRNAAASQARVVRDLSDEIAEARANNMTPDLLIARRAAEATKLNGMVQLAEGARAEAGRTLRTYRQQATLIEMNPDQAIQQIYKRLGGKENAEAAVDEYTKLVQDGAGPIQIAKFWAKVESGEITGADLFALYRRFNMLSGPRTFEVNALSGAGNLGYEVASQALGQVARGRLAEAGAEFAAPIKASNRAFKNLAETMWHGVSAEQAARGDIPRNLSSRTDNRAAKGALTVLEIPDRVNAGVDQFFRTMTEDWAATKLAHQQARADGLNPRSKAWNETVAQKLEAIRDDPTKFPEIKEMADHVTFSEDMGALGTALAGVQRVPYIGNLLMPFLRTPYNIASRAIDMSPIGIARTAVEATAGVGRGRTNISRRVRDNVVGTAAALWAYDQAQQGNLTGAGPDDPEKIAELRATGWQPFSIKVGDRYHSYANFAPFSLTLSLAAAASEAQKYKKPGKEDTLSMLADAAGRTAKVVTDMTVLAGIGSIIKSIEDPDRYGGRWLSSTLSTLIPAGSALNTAGQMLDPTLRRAERDTFANQVTGDLLARIPPNPLTPDRTDVPAAQDPLGRPIPNDQTGINALDPTRSTRERPDPVLQAFIDAKVDIGKPLENVSDDGATIALTPAEQRRWNEIRGQQIIVNTQRRIDNGVLARMPASRRAEQLQDIKTDAADRATMAMRRELGPAEWNRRKRESQAKAKAAS